MGTKGVMKCKRRHLLLTNSVISIGNTTSYDTNININYIKFMRSRGFCKLGLSDC